LPGRIFADKRERPKIADEHHTVPSPVTLNLLCPGHMSDIFTWRLRLDDAARGVLDKERVIPDFLIAGLPTKLVCREQPTVR